MEVKEPRERIRENISNHKQFLSSKRCEQLTVSNSLPTEELKQFAIGSPQQPSANENDYETTKPPADRSRRFEEETDVLLADELRREQQKCRILEERLRNKQLFIVQLKDFQSELNLAFEKSQAELHAAMLHNDELLEAKQQLLRENEQVKRLLFHMEQTHKSNILERSQRLGGRKQEQRSYSQRQLVTVAPGVAFGSDAATKLAEGISCTTEEAIRDSKRIGKFVKYVWELVASCSREATRTIDLRSKLKLSWKLLKDLVRESAKIREENIQLQASHDQLSRVLGTHRPLDQLQRLNDENRQYLHLVRLAMDYFRLPDDCTASRLEIVLKEGLKKPR